MSSMEEEIPALFHETIPALIKEESPENVKRFANIIQSKEFSNIFVCIKEPTQTFQQYEATLHRYKSFTIWLLGHFFYLLNSEKLESVQDVIIDVQLSILEQLSKTHLHIYQELAVEYCKALEMLMNFYEGSDTFNLELKVFIPASESTLSNKLNPIFINVTSKEKSLVLVGKLLKFYKFILSESFKFYSFDPSTGQTLDHLTNFLSVCNFSCVLQIFDIFINITKFIKYLHPDCSSNLLNKLRNIGSLLEQNIYDVYNKVFQVTNDEFATFEDFLYKYLVIESDLINNVRIIEFLYKKILHFNNTAIPNNKIKQFCCNSNAFLTTQDTSHQFIVNKNENILFLLFKDDIISELLKNNSLDKELKAFDSSICITWSVFHNLIISKIEQTSCSSDNSCQIVTLLNFLNNIMDVLLEIEIKFRQKSENKTKLIFFDEEIMFYLVLKLFNDHISTNCTAKIDEEVKIFKLFINLFITMNSNNAHVIFYIISCKLSVPAVFSNVNQIPNTFLGINSNLAANKHSVKNLYTFLIKEIDEICCIKYLNHFLKIISTNLNFNINRKHLENIEENYIKIIHRVINSNKEKECCLLIQGIPYILTIFNNLDLVYNKMVLPLLFSSNEKILSEISCMISTMICYSSSDFTKILRIQEDDIEIITFCNECFNINQNNSKDFIDKRFQNETLLVTDCKKIKFDLSKSILTIIKQMCNFLVNKSTNLKLNTLNSLPSLSKHVEKFHSDSTILKIWIKLIDDEEKSVRLKLAEIISKIIRINENDTNLDILFETILRVTKKSLQFSDFPLQETIIRTIEPISLIKSNNNRIQIDCFQILLYLIMIPTSKYKILAVNRCLQMAEKCDTTIPIMYCEYRHVLCELIVHLCAVNQALINYNLSTSLEKVSLMLGYYGVKDFIAQESSYLLPYFVAKIPKMPAVKQLISEIATLMEFEIEELLTQKYGNIFLYIFLNENIIQDYNACMTYIEEKTKKSGPTLRKVNLRVIFNELFLHFREKKDRVLLALTLLAKEVSEISSTSITDYIQTQFLGILLHFDIKLITKTSKKDKILQSLADVLRYMGIKHITPLRFKIITMLQTANYEDYPDSICEVWDAFVHTCQIELLAPQLATIFVSILPLIDNCPHKVNNIFKYLIVENEQVVKEYIPDLFFVKNNDLVDRNTIEMIEKYFKILDEASLKKKIKQFLKYLQHEHSGIRIYGLKHLKKYFEQSRSELNELILACNGIDVNIVELIEILARLCREKDNGLKLACGDLIGELGAVEPSHLPRKYNQGGESFSFFIHEDAFILSSLNELIKSFQADKNNRNNSNNFALAIQEILKTYEISPETNSGRNRLWLQLNQQQQELIYPFLSSKYMLREIVNPNFLCPIYGSASCTSFTVWLETWACYLINLLSDEYKSLLQKCWASMRKDQRLLMHFLPYILLHFLLEDTDNRSEKCFIEFKTITSSFFNKKTLNTDLLNTRPMPIPGIPVPREIITPEQEMQIQCTKVVFILLDFLDRWIREWHWLNGQQGQTNEHYKNINEFLNRFSKLELAKCNFQCGEYVRALMYLENYMSENSDDFNGNLQFLAEIYAQLDECDGVAGVTAIQQTEPSIEQRILALEISGKLPEAVVCYERMPQPLKLHHIQGLVQCHLDLDNVNTALNFIQGSINNDINFGNMLWEMQAEPLWRLGRYDDLSTLLKRSDLAKNNCWGVQIGHALLHLKNNDRKSFQTVLNALKLQQVDNFGAATLEEGAYQHGYNYILRLHALNELEHLQRTISELQIQPNDKSSVENIMKQLINEWDLRIKVVQDSVRVVEPLLSLRRVGLDLGKRIAEEKVKSAVPFFSGMLGEYWLESAKLARLAGISQQAYTYTIKAEEFAPDRLFLEKAELHWIREEREQALTTLKRGLETIQSEYSSSSDINKKKILAEAKLLIACYNDTMANVDTELNSQFYKDAYDVYKEWEKSLVCIGHYYDRLFQLYPENEKDETKGSTLQLYIMNYFGKSLKYGTKYVYQSMPRMLSVWFDYGTRSLNVEESRIKEERKQHLLKMTQLIDHLLNCLPSYVFLTAFSQLVSRICHPQKDVYSELKSIIIKLLQNYPQQTLWMFISVIKSSYTIRTKKCAEILNDSRLQLQVFTKLVKDFTSFAEKLIELCHKEIQNDLTPVVSKLVKTLPRLLAQPDFSNIMMPTQKFRKLVLPNPDSKQQNPFPNSYAYIVRIEDEITIVQSLQKPRKIAFRGSDGNRYNFILKANDDLRKDFRLLEFNDIVNQLLSQDSESRQRRLNIRLYSVAPLNENSGIIEWVPNLLGLQPIIANLYKKYGFGIGGRQLQKYIAIKNDSLSKKREVYTKILLPNHPPVLSHWFRRTFPDAQSWFAARTAYIRTTAVMSMAGYILGLGDRHGQNILLDSTCGDVVHVDFNCIFNKGELFDWPERVPFRLTHNMVSAMGPLGVEGVFRKSCACTLRVLRTNVNTLMSIITPVAYDPLVSWPKYVGNVERIDEKAMDHIRNIQLRLKGVVKSKTSRNSIPLSVEGQVNILISEAMSIDNLCQMFIGWGAYL